MYRAFGSALLALPVLLLGTAASAQQTQQPLLPKTINLPVGFQPEGITKGPGTRAFVGTLNGGGVVDVDLVSGQTKFLVQPGTDRMATGLTYSERANAIVVCGAGTGKAFVYDATSGQQLAAITLTTQTPNFINDVRIGGGAAFFTDSMRPVIYRVPLGSDGRTPGAVQEIPLPQNFGFVAGQLNANGIISVLDGKFLLVVKTNTGEIFRVDPTNGASVKLNLGPDNALNGDGLLLEGNRLLAVQNNNNQIAVFELDQTYTSGRLVSTLRDPDFRVPTTVAEFDGNLFAVNARFNEVPGGQAKPTDQFNVVRVAR